MLEIDVLIQMSTKVLDVGHSLYLRVINCQICCFTFVKLFLKAEQYELCLGGIHPQTVLVSPCFDVCCAARQPGQSLDFTKYRGGIEGCLEGMVICVTVYLNVSWYDTVYCAGV